MDETGSGSFITLQMSQFLNHVAHGALIINDLSPIKGEGFAERIWPHYSEPFSELI